MNTFLPLTKPRKQKSIKKTKNCCILFLDNSFTAGTFKLFFPKLFSECLHNGR